MVYVRATGEIGTFIKPLEIMEGTSQALVSLPKVNKEGAVEHDIHITFFPEELETFQERITREVEQLL